MTQVSPAGHSIASPPSSCNIHEFNIMQTALDKGETQEAIQYLLFNLKNIKNIPDLTKVYYYIFDLMPNMHQEEIRNLIPLAHHLCEATPTLRKEQGDLALQLAKWHADFALTHQFSFAQYFSYYHQAMDYFAKAIQIVPHRDCHNSASELLMKAFETLALDPEYGFEERLDFAISLDNIEKFQEILYQIKELRSFCWGTLGSKLIKQLYNIVVKLVNKRSENCPTRFQSYIPQVIEEIQQSDFIPAAPKEYPTEKYLGALKIFRAKFDHLGDLNGVSRENMTEATRCFINIFLSDVWMVIGFPPCGYDLRAMGSIGREEICRFSDLEVMILIEKKSCKAYFKLLIKLLDLQIRSLGETAASHLKIIFNCIHTKNPSGFYLDIGDRFIREPQDLANLQRIPNDDPATFAHMALSSASLSCNQEALFTQYKAAVDLILREDVKEGLSRGKALALGFIEERIYDYHNLSLLEDVKDLKKNYIQPINLLLADIGLYWNIFNCSTQEVIQALEKQGVFTSKSCSLMREFSNGIYGIRLKLHAHYKEQKEEGYLTGYTTNQRYVLSPQDQLLLDRCEYLVLKPLYFLLTQLVKNKSLDKNGNFMTLFSQVDLIQVALEDLILTKIYAGPNLNKLSQYVNNSSQIQAYLKNFIQNKQFFSLKLYEELGLSIGQVVDVILHAWHHNKTVFLVCKQKSVKLGKEDLQNAQREDFLLKSPFYAQILIKLSQITLTKRFPFAQTIHKLSLKGNAIKIYLGEELKYLLTPFDPVIIAQWADHVHQLYIKELSQELSHTLECLSLMCLGKEFEYPPDTLLKLSRQLINNEEGFLHYLQNA